MTPILLDTDPGIDDTMAIFYAMADPEIELVGMTTVLCMASTDSGTHPSHLPNAALTRVQRINSSLKLSLLAPAKSRLSQ